MITKYYQYINRAKMEKWLNAINSNLINNTNYSLIQMRQFAEYFSLQVVNKEFPNSTNLSFAERLDLLLNEQLIDFKTYQLCSAIRLIGNKAVHSSYKNKDVAKQMYSVICEVFVEGKTDNCSSQILNFKPDELKFIGYIFKAGLSTDHPEKNKFFIPDIDEKLNCESEPTFCYIPGIDLDEFDTREIDFEEDASGLPLYTNIIDINDLFTQKECYLYTEYKGNFYEVHTFFIDNSIEEVELKYKNQIFLGYINTANKIISKESHICEIISPLYEYDGNSKNADEFFGFITNLCLVDSKVIHKSEGDIFPLYAECSYSFGGNIRCSYFIFVEDKKYTVTPINSSYILQLIDKDISIAFDFFYTLREYNDFFIQLTLGYKDQLDNTEVTEVNIYWPPYFRKEILNRNYNHTQFQYVKGMLIYSIARTYGKNDYKAALSFLRSAADNNHMLAATLVGEIYERGIACNKDYGKALHYYEIAAKKGYATAQRKLGFFYEFGKGIAVNSKMSFDWYKLAAKQGDYFSINKLKSKFGVENY